MGSDPVIEPDMASVLSAPRLLAGSQSLSSNDRSYELVDQPSSSTSGSTRPNLPNVLSQIRCPRRSRTHMRSLSASAAEPGRSLLGSRLPASLARLSLESPRGLPAYAMPALDVPMPMGYPQHTDPFVPTLVPQISTVDDSINIHLPVLSLIHI